jgi:hypothetical protein
VVNTTYMVCSIMFNRTYQKNLYCSRRFWMMTMQRNNLDDLCVCVHY